MPVPGCAKKENVGEAAEHATDGMISMFKAALAKENAPAWFAPPIAAGCSLERIFGINDNFGAGDGRSIPFRIIPFADGTLPTGPLHNLPALVNIDIINALSPSDINAYLNGYNIKLQRPYTNEAGRKAICAHGIGCSL